MDSIELDVYNPNSTVLENMILPRCLKMSTDCENTSHRLMRHSTTNHNTKYPHLFVVTFLHLYICICIYTGRYRYRYIYIYQKYDDQSPVTRHCRLGLASAEFFSARFSSCHQLLQEHTVRDHCGAATGTTIRATIRH